MLLNVLFVAAAMTSPSVVDLRCEYLAEPLGIDVATPRLSWRLESADARRGLRQTGYRVLVAGSKRLLAGNHGDLWDSGEVHSNQSCFVEYGGSKLRSEQECWWKVRVSDETGKLSPWSKPSRWTMGLLEPGDWEAKWIGPYIPNVDAYPDPINEDPWLLREFTLDRAPSRVVMYVASRGFHELYVNGQKVGDAVLSQRSRTFASAFGT